MTGALARVSFAAELAPVAPDTLEGAYLHLDAVDQARAAFAARLAEEHRRLDDRRAYVLGSLSAARRFLDDDGPGEGTDLVKVEDETKGQLDAAVAEVEGWAEAEAAALDAAWEASVAAVEDRVAAYATHRRPHLEVTVHRLAGGRRIVQVARLSRDDAVLVCALLAGRPPLRHAFLEDDAVEAVGGPVHLAVRTGDVDPEAVTAGGADAEDALTGAEAPRLLPIRAHLPVHLPGVDWPHLRLMARGPVLELQSRDEGAPYAHVVSEADAELLTGYLVSLRVRGRLEVEVEIE